MNRPLRQYAVIALAVIVVGILETSLFGSDHAGTRHDISVIFFLLAVLGLVALVVLGLVGLTRRTRTART